MKYFNCAGSMLWLILNDLCELRGGLEFVFSPDVIPDG